MQKYNTSLHILFFLNIPTSFFFFLFLDSSICTCLGAYKKTETVRFKTDNYLKPNSIKYAT